MEWSLRVYDDPNIDLAPRYDKNSPLFTLDVHYGGKFVDNPEKVHCGGLLSNFDNIDPDKFSLQEVYLMGKILGCQNIRQIWYRIPNMDLSNGMRILQNDRDALGMCKWVPAFRNIDVYIEVEDAIFDEINFDLDGFQVFNDDPLQVFSDIPVNEEKLESENLVDSDYRMSDEEVLFETNVEECEQLYVNQLGMGNTTCEMDASRVEKQQLSDPDIVSDDLQSIHSFDDEINSKPRFLEFNPERNLKVVNFELGMLFASPQHFRDAVREYAIQNKKDIKFVKNDKLRTRAKCVAPCEWMVFASKLQGEDTFQVKTLETKHTNCRPSYYNKHVTSKWLSNKYVDAIQSNPQWPLQAFRETVKRDHIVGVTRSQVYRAKRKALVLINGTHKDQYAMLWRYCAEIKRAMPTSTVRIHIDENNYDDPNSRFKRMYVSLGPLKKGFIDGCRPFIGLDGCFLKGPFPGELLSAVGIDAKYGIFPFAYAVVEKECKKSWIWFLELLCEDICMDTHFNYTFICDQQKGLIPALDHVVPHCEHRFCVRHHYNNFKKEFRGKMFKDLFWKCAKASTVEYLPSVWRM